jgi:hypothetical protein
MVKGCSWLTSRTVRADEVEEIVRRVHDYVTIQPLGSVLALTDSTGASFDRDAIRAIKETAVFDKCP